MKVVRYVIADVFTNRPFAGNQLAVFTDARVLDAATMQGPFVSPDSRLDVDIDLDGVPHLFSGDGIDPVYMTSQAAASHGEFGPRSITRFPGCRPKSSVSTWASWLVRRTVSP